MAQIIITAEFRGRKRLYTPGTYTIPGDITMPEARCCVQDCAGMIVTEETASAAATFRKGPAPENKLRGPSPENKTPVVDGDRSGDGAGADGGSRKRTPRAKRPGSE